MRTKTRVLYASNLLGAKVNSGTGEELGELSEIMVDGGIVTYGIVKAGAADCSARASSTPVPFPAIRHDATVQTAGDALAAAI